MRRAGRARAAPRPAPRGGSRGRSPGGTGADIGGRLGRRAPVVRPRGGRRRPGRVLVRGRSRGAAAPGCRAVAARRAGGGAVRDCSCSVMLASSSARSPPAAASDPTVGRSAGAALGAACELPGRGRAAVAGARTGPPATAGRSAEGDGLLAGCRSGRCTCGTSAIGDVQCRSSQRCGPSSERCSSVPWPVLITSSGAGQAAEQHVPGARPGQVGAADLQVGEALVPMRPDRRPTTPPPWPGARVCSTESPLSEALRRGGRELGDHGVVVGVADAEHRDDGLPRSGGAPLARHDDDRLDRPCGHAREPPRPAPSRRPHRSSSCRGR